MPRRPRRSAGGVYDRHSLRTRSSTNAAKAPGLERQPIRHSESRAATALAQRGLRCVGCPSLLDVTRSTSPTSSPAHGLWPDCRRSGLGAPHSEALAGPARRAVRPWPRRQRSVVIYRRRASSLQPGDIRPQDASAGATSLEEVVMADGFSVPGRETVDPGVTVAVIPKRRPPLVSPAAPIPLLLWPG
jgi:hypothetical protein